MGLKLRALLQKFIPESWSPFDGRCHEATQGPKNLRVGLASVLAVCPATIMEWKDPSCLCTLLHVLSPEFKDLLPPIQTLPILLQTPPSPPATRVHVTAPCYVTGKPPCLTCVCTSSDIYLTTIVSGTGQIEDADVAGGLNAQGAYGSRGRSVCVRACACIERPSGHPNSQVSWSLWTMSM